jgi:hypothetical protein
MADDPKAVHDLRWLWLGVAIAGAGVGTYWLAQGAPLFAAAPDWDIEIGGVAGYAATAARFSVLVAICATAVALIAMLAGARTHYLSPFTSLVCALAGVAGLALAGLHAQVAAGLPHVQADGWMPAALGAMAALAVGGFGLWRDARVEHHRAEHDLASIERAIHEHDHDLM